MISPSEPGAIALASRIRSANGAPPVSPWIQLVSEPLVDMPAASVCWPGSTPAVVQSLGCTR